MLSFLTNLLSANKSATLQRSLFVADGGITIDMSKMKATRVDPLSKLVVVQGRTAILCNGNNPHSLEACCLCLPLHGHCKRWRAHSQACNTKSRFTAGGVTYADIADATKPHGLALPWGDAYKTGPA